MRYRSTGTSFSHNNGMKGEAMGSRTTECEYNLSTSKSYISLNDILTLLDLCFWLSYS